MLGTREPFENPFETAGQGTNVKIIPHVGAGN